MSSLVSLGCPRNPSNQPYRFLVLSDLRPTRVKGPMEHWVSGGGAKLGKFDGNFDFMADCHDHAWILNAMEG